MVYCRQGCLVCIALVSQLSMLHNVTLSELILRDRSAVCIHENEARCPLRFVIRRGLLGMKRRVPTDSTRHQNRLRVM